MQDYGSRSLCTVLQRDLVSGATSSRARLAACAQNILIVWTGSGMNPARQVADTGMVFPLQKKVEATQTRIVVEFKSLALPGGQDVSFKLGPRELIEVIYNTVVEFKKSFARRSSCSPVFGRTVSSHAPAIAGRWRRSPKITALGRRAPRSSAPVSIPALGCNVVLLGWKMECLKLSSGSSAYPTRRRSCEPRPAAGRPRQLWRRNSANISWRVVGRAREDLQLVELRSDLVLSSIPVGRGPSRSSQFFPLGGFNRSSP